MKFLLTTLKTIQIRDRREKYYLSASIRLTNGVVVDEIGLIALVVNGGAAVLCFLCFFFTERVARATLYFHLSRKPQ